MAQTLKGVKVRLFNWFSVAFKKARTANCTSCVFIVYFEYYLFLKNPSFIRITNLNSVRLYSKCLFQNNIFLEKN